jgi:putative transposase
MTYNILDGGENRQSHILDVIQPGKPAQNAYVERFNRTFREDVLDAYLFHNLSEVHIAAEHWLGRIQHHPSACGITGLITPPV